MLNVSKVTSLAFGAVVFMTAWGCSSGDSGAPVAGSESNSELAAARACASTTQCASGEYCTTEDGVCNRPPGCTPGKICPALCYGTCQPREPKPQFCGGIAGIACPDGQTCVDDPSDGCDPNNGGADCGGICVKKPSKCDYTDPHRRYVARSPKRCSVIRFFCAAGTQYFSDSCGCGCETVN